MEGFKNYHYITNDGNKNKVDVLFYALKYIGDVRINKMVFIFEEKGIKSEYLSWGLKDAQRIILNQDYKWDKCGNFILSNTYSQSDPLPESTNGYMIAKVDEKYNVIKIYNSNTPHIIDVTLTSYSVENDKIYGVH